MLPTVTVLSVVLGPLQDILRDRFCSWILVFALAVIPGGVAVASNFANVVLRYATMLLIALFNFMYFAIAPGLLSNMYGKRIGLTAWGAVLAVSAAANLSNYEWALLAESVGWFPLNVTLHGATCVMGVILTVFVYRWERRYKRRLSTIGSET